MSLIKSMAIAALFMIVATILFITVTLTVSVIVEVIAGLIRKE